MLMISYFGDPAGFSRSDAHTQSIFRVFYLPCLQSNLNFKLLKETTVLPLAQQYAGGKYMNILGKKTLVPQRGTQLAETLILGSEHSFKGGRVALGMVARLARLRQVLIFTRSKQDYKVK